MALYLIVVQAHFIMNNVFEGMIWFFLPVSLVICNDIFAYICGITFGRTQLIKLSPKKTVEGFVGAWVLTIIFGVGMTNVLMRYKYFICPVNVSTALHVHLKLLLTKPGSRSKYLDRPPMHSQPRLHSPHLPTPNLVPIRQIILNGTNAGTHPRLRHIRLSHCSLWGFLRLRS
jgi:phosphatidate cytidylyltransferase